MAKEKVSKDEKFENTEIALFDVLAALDKKDYGYYDRLTTEQQKKIVPFVLIHWVSAVKGSADLQMYYLSNTDRVANAYLLNEFVSKHPKLQWLMLCAASPGIGKQFHQWIPHIKDRVARLKEKPKTKDIKDYYKKIYPKASDSNLTLITEAYCDIHAKKMYLSSKFPHLKYDELDLLAEIITDDEIKEYEREHGN
jgi:hypothetical protein